MFAQKRVLGGAVALSLLLSLAGPMSVSAATSPTLSGASTYSVLGRSTVTNTGSTTTTGEVGVSTGTAITGFPPGVAGGNNSLHLHSNDASAIAAQSDNVAAFTTLNQSCDQTYADGQDLTLLSPLGPGVYCSLGSFALSGNLTLTGSGVWIFKAATTLITATSSSVTGGDPCNVWWRVGSSATLGTSTSFIGSILALASITMNTSATLDGRALAQTGAVTLDTNTITGPTCSAPLPSSSSTDNTLTVIKNVINDNGGTSVYTDFPLFVNGNSVDSGEAVALTAGTYTVTETSLSTYQTTFGGDCDANGQVIHGGVGTHNDVCTIVNNDIGTPVVPPVPPIIDVVKVPSPLALPDGPGLVTYSYTVRNIGTVAMTNVTLVDDSCTTVFVSGDTNADSKLDLTETWRYTCSSTLSETHTNSVLATGLANGLTATDTALATVIVGQPIVPPLIHVTKVPDPLTLSAGGGNVTYTEQVTNPGTVALSNVTLVDDKCRPVTFVSGDIGSDGLLDPTETWTYTCSAHLANTTTNTATATGSANGLTVSDFAIVTVAVAAPAPAPVVPPVVPALPNTGSTPGQVPFAGVVVVSGILATLLLIGIARKKQNR